MSDPFRSGGPASDRPAGGRNVPRGAGLASTARGSISVAHPGHWAAWPGGCDSTAFLPLFGEEETSLADAEKARRDQDNAGEGAPTITSTSVADPQVFMVRQGWARVSLTDSEQHDKLRHLHEALEGRVISLLEALDALHKSAGYELHELVSAQPVFPSKVAESQSRDPKEEIKVLDGEMKQIDLEINELQS